jgi:hypothetical protein
MVRDDEVVARLGSALRGVTTKQPLSVAKLARAAGS